MVKCSNGGGVYRWRRRISSEHRGYRWDEMSQIDGFSLILSFPRQPVPGCDGKKNKSEAIRNPNSSGLGGSQSSP